MCGVCGIVNFSVVGEADLSERRIQRMVDALAHRGPDAMGLDRSAAAHLGATRLAIRGLSGGRQPIRDVASGVVVVINGEIDNAPELKKWLRDRGRPVDDPSDVAVLPGLYLELGDRCIEELVGAFAVAVWDPRRPRLLLARDRAGERPLFYTREGGLVRFATEIAALAHDPEVPLTPDQEAIARYLRFGSFASPETPFREIRKVPPAGMVTFEADSVAERLYWRWSGATKTVDRNRLAEFDDLFRRAVLRQSDVDVEWGAFLSGGVDSSLVAAVARSVRPEIRLRAYTLRFRESSYDEGDFAGVVAARLGCEHVPVWVTPESFPDGIAELVRMVGEPLADPAWVPTALLARRAAEDVKVALVGEGADELFAGYPTYIGCGAAESYARWPGGLRRLIRRAVELWPPSDKKVTLSFLLKRFVAGAELDGVARHLFWTSNIPPELLRRIVSGPVSAPRRDAERSETGPTDEDLLTRVQRIDLETSLAEGLLTKADRASMRSALELRAPFLDRGVMEFAATLPRQERVRGTATKVFLKHYAERYLPRRIIYRKKRGLSVPLSGWLRGPLRDWAESRLSDPRLGEVGVRREAVLELFCEHVERRADHARALWTVIVLDEWLRWADDVMGSHGEE